MMEDIKNIIEGRSDALHGNGVSEESICEAENVLQCKFSEEYRAYLSLYGIAAMGGHELTGISKSARVDVVAVTQEERKFNAYVPEGCYVIERAFIDGIVIWQATDGKVYKSMPGTEPVLICNSLCDFIKNF